MTDAARKGLGTVSAILALALGVVSFIAAPEEPVAVVVQQWVFAVVTIGVGLLLVLKRPSHRIGFVMLGIGLAFSMMGTGQTMTRLSHAEGLTTRAVAWAQFEGVGWVLFILTLFNLLPLWFPTGRTSSSVGRWLLRIAVTVAAVGAFGTLFAEQTCVSWPAGGVGDDCLAFAQSPWGFLDHTVGEVAGQAVLLLTGLLSLLTLVYRFVRAQGQERQQLKWFAIGFAMFGVTLATSLAFGLNMDLVVWTTIAVVPASIALAVLRYRLYEIDRIVSRTMTYAVLVFLLAGSFLAVAAFVGAGVAEDPLFVAAATLAAAGLFNPLRKRLQVLVDRRFNRSRFDVVRVMSDFSGSLRDRVDADQIVDGWCTVVTDTMQPSSVGVWIRP
jgi:hypothetical protein